MGTFTIQQQPKSSDTWLYPNANVAACLGLTAQGCPFNPGYACINEDRLTPDDDTSYVYNNTVNLLFDLYGLPNRNLTGAINYVQVFARAKTSPVAQSKDGIFKILVSPDGICTDAYPSGDIELTTGYQLYSNVWTTNPTDSADWNWGNINLMAIGIECDSPTRTAERQLIIRPSANGDVIQLSKTGDTSNYKCVDELIKDNWTTYVWTFENTQYDLYQLDNHTTESGNITKVSIFAYINPHWSTDNWAKTVIKIAGIEYRGNQIILIKNNWNLISTSYATQPSDSSVWTWAAIDALQGGIEMMNNGGDVVGCTQLYVIVDWSEATSNPDIRTTQVYAKVNFVPPEAECTLQKPNQISTNHGRNIKMLNFWSGNRAVYDLNRSGKSMVLTGIEWDDACVVMDCIRDMGENGAKVTFSGLGSSYWDGIYYIRSFGWKHISECPDVYEYIINLEDTRYGEDAYD